MPSSVQRARGLFNSFEKRRRDCSVRLMLVVRLCSCSAAKGAEYFSTATFADGGKKEHGSSAVSRTTGRPAEVLREGSGIKVDETAGRGSQSAHIKDAGELFWQKTSRA